MQDIQYEAFQTAQEAIASKATCIEITKPGNLTPLSGAKHIKALRLVKIHLHEKLIKAFANMPNIEVLDLSNNHIKRLPSLDMPNLKQIDLNDNEGLDLRYTVATLSTLPKLQTLGLKRCELKKIPANLPQLQYITTLDIRGNQHLELPKFLLLFPNLQDIQLFPEMKLNYDKVFKALAGIPKFWHLDLHSTKRKTVPNSLKNIKTLTSLNIDITQLKDCTFLSLLDLKKLEINAPDLKTPLLEHLSNSSLQTLIIHHTIESLPEKIVEYQALEALEINLDPDNEGSFSKTLNLIATLPKLKKLHLYKHTPHFPKAFAGLSHLETITLALGNDQLLLPKEAATFTNIVFESDKPFAKKYHTYLEKYGKDAILSEALKTKYFAIMLDQKLVQEEVFPYVLDNIVAEKTLFFMAGQIEGYTQQEIKEKLKEYEYKVASKLSKKVTHLILGKNAKVEIIEQALQNPNYKLVTEAHLKRHIITMDNPLLLQTGSEVENEKMMDMLLSQTGIETGLVMMENIGASKQTLTVLYLFLTNYTYLFEKDIKKQMKKLVNRYASPSLKALFKSGKTDNTIHPDLDKATCLRVNILKRAELNIKKPVLEQLGWEGIVDVLSKGDEIKILQIPELGLKEFPISLIPYLLSLRYLNMADNDISVLPKEFLQLTNLTNLHMENCKIEDIEILTKLEKLQYLYIKNNPIKEIPEALTIHLAEM